MQNVYVVWDIEYDENDRCVGKLIDGIYDSEAKAIQGIQRAVKQIRRICEKSGGPEDHIQYLIDHVPDADEIRDNDGVYYLQVDECWQKLTYEVYCMM